MKEVTVRMYRQGLGDCFLLSFPGKEDKPFHMLIDCGALNSKRYTSELMVRVVEHIIGVTDGYIDVIVLTHEHWDHISGFSQAATLFDKPGPGVRSKWVVGAVGPELSENPWRDDVEDL